MIFFVQTNIFKSLTYNQLIENIGRFGFPYQLVEFHAESNDLKFDPVDTDNVFCFGSVKIAHHTKKYGWNPGSLFNENHDYRVYSQYYKENMLNWDCQILKLGDEFQEPGYIFHARPCEDTKSFTGQVFTKESWNDWKSQVLALDNKRLTVDTAVQISKVQNIYKEIRFFIVDGKIITASQYRINNITRYEECFEPYLFDYVNEMIKLYQPAKAFVMDIAVTDAGLKIVELNCINCSGFYNCDLQKIINSIYDCFNVE